MLEDRSRSDKPLGLFLAKVFSALMNIGHTSFYLILKFWKKKYKVVYICHCCMGEEKSVCGGETGKVTVKFVVL